MIIGHSIVALPAAGGVSPAARHPCAPRAPPAASTAPDRHRHYWPRRAAVLLLVALLLPQPALAQQRVKPGALQLAGYWATCGPVETEVLKINDIAASVGMLIVLNPSLFELPRAQQLFWYTHECGHQIFGPSETLADCWSVEQGRIQGWLDKQEFEDLFAAIRRLPGDATHAPGAARAAYLRRCYER